MKGSLSAREAIESVTGVPPRKTPMERLAEELGAFLYPELPRAEATEAGWRVMAEKSLGRHADE